MELNLKMSLTQRRHRKKLQALRGLLFLELGVAGVEVVERVGACWEGCSLSFEI